MKLKKYYAETMQDALKIIKEEIGPDAVILSSKYVKTKKGFLGLFSKKQIEVVVSYEEEKEKKEESKAAELRRFTPVMEHAQQEAVLPPVDIARFEPLVVPQVEMPVHATAGNPYAALADIRRKEEEPAQVLGNLQMQQQPQATPGLDVQETAEKLKKIDSLDESINELKSLINNLSSRVENYSGGTEERLSLDVRNLFNLMVDNDVQRNLATDLCVRTEQIIAGRDADPKEVLKSLILDMMGEVKPIQYTKYKRKVVMLIGPTGVGKTTTLVKLASKLLYEDKLDIGMINADVFRVAAQEHLKAYCDILNADLITIYRPEEVVDALEAFKAKDIVFIDTAGKLSSNPEYQEEIGALLKLGQVDEVYLLVSASTSEKVITKILADYSFMNVYSIIITKVDETPTFGSVLYISKESGKPLSYVTTGQNVPDDLAEMVPEEIVDSILESNHDG
ncbi:flagellar biosynthesis protein FlhF [Christensenellaceae bacterium OttesenSCG-928-K19]|nr:flagellar biosynthesis protein FlhF [Christensenellaceae bacterium OttesenSCG-928-K19]